MNDPVLRVIDILCLIRNEIADVLCAVRDHIADRIHGERCPTCWQRTRHLPAHIAIDHAEVRG